MKFTKLVSIGMIAGMAMALSGCFDSTPKCDDKEVQKELLELVKKQGKQEGVTQKQLDLMDVSFSHFTTEKVDKEAKKVTCKVQVSLKISGKEVMSETGYFTAQRTDDGKLLVEDLGEE